MEQKNGEIWKRIAQIRQYFCDGNNVIFAERLEKEPTYTSQLCNGTKATGEKILELILQKFPEVSRVWLFFGEGEMLSAGGGAEKAQRSNSEPSVPLSLYADAIRENERLRMEVERLREKVKSLSARMGEECILP